MLYVGRLSREKGLTNLEAVRQQLEGRNIQHRVIFTGDGPLRRMLEASSPPRSSPAHSPRTTWRW
ncbi:MAG: hypothetical protein QM736_12265 [Vicinamibacterales bacterium]